MKNLSTLREYELLKLKARAELEREASRARFLDQAMTTLLAAMALAGWGLALALLG